MPTESSNYDAIYFEQRLGVSYDALLAPIEAAFPSGKALRGSAVYSAIAQARRQDDASLPLGNWEYELKRADWDKVGRLAADALVTQSKDLQLAAWLLEAQINQSGFAGIAACLGLMQYLCEHYWDSVYPNPDDGDMESRANIFRWINEKLLPTLRLVPITSSGRQRDYCWSDMEQARRNEQLKATSGRNVNNGKNAEELIEGATNSEISGCMSATPTDVFSALQTSLSRALSSIDALGLTLDRQLGEESPSMAAIAGLLQQILSVAEGELYKRGVRTQVSIESEPVVSDSPVAHLGNGVMPLPAVHAEGPIRDRADAYVRLAEAAEFLMRVEPHSPVPYVVRRATEWGGLNTVELYQELFLKLGGQLNIFEMLGLQSPEVAA